MASEICSKKISPCEKFPTLLFPLWLCVWKETCFEFSLQRCLSFIFLQSSFYPSFIFLQPIQIDILPTAPRDPLHLVPWDFPGAQAVLALLPWRSVQVPGTSGLATSPAGRAPLFPDTVPRTSQRRPATGLPQNLCRRICHAPEHPLTWKACLPVTY